MSEKIEGTIALVTGANRGIGRAITEALLQRGAAKVYAGARNPQSLTDLSEHHADRVVPIEIDVTDAEKVVSAAEQAGDVRLLINNAGAAFGGGLADANIAETAQQEIDVNYIGPLRLIQQFSAILGSNGGGAIVNVVSVAGLTNFAFFPTYSASKAAAHSLTQGSRALLAGQGTTVHGVYPGPVDTAMAESVDMDKATPADVASAILDGVESGTEDIYPDAFAEQFGQQFSESPKASEQQMAAMIAST